MKLSNLKKILVISESIDIEDSSASKVNVALILNLKKIGYDVKVLHYTRKKIQLEGVKSIVIPEIKLSLNYLLSRSQRVFQRLTKINISNRLENIFGHSFTFFNDSKSISKTVKKYYDNENLIITLSKGASFRPHHAMLSLPNLHDKWMAYVHDPYPFHYYPRPYDWLEAGAKFKEKFFREVSEKAKYSGFPSLMLKEWMGGYFPNFLKTGVIIPHQNLEIDQNKEQELPDYIDTSKFNILHAGNMFKERPPHFLIKGYQMFLKNNPEAINASKLILLGGTDENYLDYLNKARSNNIYWSKGSVKFKEALMLQNNTSVNVIIEGDSSISPFLPGKFPNCINANKPILLLSPYYSETKRLLGSDYNFISELKDSKKISILIGELYFNWKKDRNQKLDRDDLGTYLGLEYLLNTLSKLN
ncbi:glycosyltransferase family 4 protein [Polaribacter sp. IC073]|nr:glycosyltransferase family 4 protein [Polaribacter sp. IC073]